MDETTKTESNAVTEAAEQAGSKETQTQAAPAPKQTPESTAAFRALMDREKQLRTYEQKLKQEASELQQIRELKAVANQKPLEAMKALGISYEDVVKRVSKGERTDPVAPLQSELQELRQMVQTMQQREEDAARQAQTQKAQQGLREYVSNSEELALTKELDASDLVFDYMQQQFQATGQWVSEADAAREVETYLSGLVEKALKNEAIRSKFLPSQPSKATETPHVTNRDASQVESRDPSQRLTTEERIKLAADTLNARLRGS